MNTHQQKGHGTTTDMSDQQIPDDLIDLKRRLLTLDAQLARFAKTLPRSMAIATGQASLTKEQQETWTGMQTELTELALQIHRHPFLAALAPKDRYPADRAATKAAKTLLEQEAPIP